MYVVGVGLVKVYKALIRLVCGGTVCSPSEVYVRSFLCPFKYLKKKNDSTTQKLLSDQVWSPKAKSSLENMNQTPFNVSYHCPENMMTYGHFYFLRVNSLMPKIFLGFREC